MPTFAVLDRDDSRADGHVFEALACSDGAVSLVEELSDRVRDLYVDEEDMRQVLQAQVAELAGPADPGLLAEIIDRVVNASIPPPGTHPVAQFDVARNEVAEVLSLFALEEHHRAVVPAPRIRNKEIPGAPTRGLDAVGLTSEPLAAYVTEAKASDQNSSPPDVVDAGATSLRGQYESFFGDTERLLAELNRAFKQTRDDAHRELIARALAAHVTGELPIVVAPALLRPEAQRGTDDCGSFRATPEAYAPSRVHFCVLSVADTLENLAGDIYTRARS